MKGALCPFPLPRIQSRLNPSDNPIAFLYKFKYNSYREEDRRVETN
jgi:hypothetical protein